MEIKTWSGIPNLVVFNISPVFRSSDGLINPGHWGFCSLWVGSGDLDLHLSLLLKELTSSVNLELVYTCKISEEDHFHLEKQNSHKNLSNVKLSNISVFAI